MGNNQYTLGCQDSANFTSRDEQSPHVKTVSPKDSTWTIQEETQLEELFSHALSGKYRKF
jgi:hypothetical protein